VGLGDERRAQKRDDFMDFFNIGDARGELKSSRCVTSSQYCWDRRITSVQYFWTALKDKCTRLIQEPRIFQDAFSSTNT